MTIEDTQEISEGDVDEELNELIAASGEGSELADDEVEIDLSEAATFEPFTARVPVEVTGAALKHGKASTKPYIELKLRVFEGEYAKRVLWTNINLTGLGAGFGFDKLSLLGATSKDGQLITSKNRRISLGKLVGLRCLVDCAPDEREEYAHKVVVGKFYKYVSAAESEAENLK
jgi:hypothetical protein